MKTIKRINPQSLANFYAYFLIICAITFGIFLSFANIVQRIIEGNHSVGDLLLIIAVNIISGLLVGLISSVAAFLIGYISGFLFASLYNTAVKVGLFHGIQIEAD